MINYSFFSVTKGREGTRNRRRIYKPAAAVVSQSVAHAKTGHLNKPEINEVAEKLLLANLFKWRQHYNDVDIIDQAWGKCLSPLVADDVKRRWWYKLKVVFNDSKLPLNNGNWNWFDKIVHIVQLHLLTTMTTTGTPTTRKCVNHYFPHYNCISHSTIQRPLMEFCRCTEDSIKSSEGRVSLVLLKGSSAHHYKKTLLGGDK